MGKALKVLGSIVITVGYSEQEKILNLLIAAGSGPSLLGHDWLREIHLDWHTLNLVQINLQAILDNHPNVFSDELDLVKGVVAGIHINSQMQPWFFKPPIVPYAPRAKVEQEHERPVLESSNQCNYLTGLHQ